jgi:hypothetical protein
MKMTVTIVIAAVVVGGVAVLVMRGSGERRERLPAGAFLVSVRACDGETAQVLPFSVSTDVAGTNVPIQQVALHDFTLATFCQWADATARTFTVASPGYLPRRYTATGRQDIAAVLCRPE